MKSFILILALLGLTNTVFAYKQFDNVTIGDFQRTNDKAVLELVSTTKGFLLPRMTTVQRDAIVAPVPVGLQVYNTDTDLINFWNGASWSVFGVTTLQQAYDASLAGDVELTNAIGGFTITDDTGTPVTGNIFEVEDTASAEILGVVPTGVNVTQLNVDGNLRLDNAALTAQTLNSDITIQPNGTGQTIISSNLDVTGDMQSTSANIDNVRIDANTIDTTDVNGDLNLDANGTGTVISLSKHVFNTETADRVPYLNASKELTTSSIDSTELGHLDGATQNIQSALDLKLESVDLTSDVYNVLPIANGGTGSATRNFVDLTSAETVDGIKTFDKEFGMVETATPAANPAAGYNKLYFKSDDLLYILNSAGTEAAVGEDRANRTLSNLTSPTQINQNLEFPDKNKTIGSGTQPLLSLRTNDVQFYDYTALTQKGRVNGGNGNFVVNGFTYGFEIESRPTYNMGITTASEITNDTPDLYLMTGESTGGGASNNTGDIKIKTGDVAGSGARGTIELDSPTVDITGKVVVTSTQDSSTPCPVMTNTQRDAIGSPSTGSCIYSSTDSVHYQYNGTDWIIMGGGAGDSRLNLLEDGSFEFAAGTKDSATCSGSCALSQVTTILESPNNESALRINFSAAAETFQIAKTPSTEYTDVRGVMSGWFNSGAAHDLCVVIDSVSDCVTMNTDGEWYYMEIPFTFGSTSANITISSADGSSVLVDELSFKAREKQIFSQISEQLLHVNVNGSFDTTTTNQAIGSGLFTTNNTPASHDMSIEALKDVTITVNAQLTYNSGRSLFQIYAPDATTEIGVADDSTSANHSNNSPVSYRLKAGESLFFKNSSTGTFNRGYVSIKAQVTNDFASALCDGLDCINSFNAYVTNGSSVGTVSNENADFLNGNCTEATDGTYVCPFQTNLFSVAPNCTATATVNNFRYATLVSTTGSVTVYTRTHDTASIIGSDFVLRCDRTGADYNKSDEKFIKITNSVTTPGNASPKLYSATISSSGVVSNEIGGFISGDCTNSSPNTCTFEATAFDSIVNCTVSESGASSQIFCEFDQQPSTTDVRIKCFTHAGADVTTSHPKNLICHGQ